MPDAVDQIVPASNFAVRRISNFRVNITAHSYILVSGYGIFDIAANAWVAYGEKQHGVHVPTTYPLKRTATLAVSEGLIAGYPVVSEGQAAR